jgi:hypothetical protein
LWTGPKVAQWMGGRTGRTIHPQRGWASRSRCPVLVTTKPTPSSKSCSSASCQNRSDRSSTPILTPRWKSGRWMSIVWA